MKIKINEKSLYYNLIITHSNVVVINEYYKYAY